MFRFVIISLVKFKLKKTHFGNCNRVRIGQECLMISFFPHLRIIRFDAILAPSRLVWFKKCCHAAGWLPAWHKLPYLAILPLLDLRYIIFGALDSDRNVCPRLRKTGTVKILTTYLYLKISSLHLNSLSDLTSLLYFLTRHTRHPANLRKGCITPTQFFVLFFQKVFCIFRKEYP